MSPPDACSLGHASDKSSYSSPGDVVHADYLNFLPRKLYKCQALLANKISFPIIHLYLYKSLLFPIRFDMHHYFSFRTTFGFCFRPFYIHSNPGHLFFKKFLFATCCGCFYSFMSKMSYFPNIEILNLCLCKVNILLT